MAAPKRTAPELKLGIRYIERRKNPPPGLVWRSVDNAGETLESIAFEYGLRAIDLALYNWHTIETDKINWYLYEYVGCRNYKDKWYVFPGKNIKKNKARPYILVPDYPPDLRKAPPKKVNVPRKKKDATDDESHATYDTKLQVHVLEWLASGETREVFGKWLYVFSGQGGTGVNFGHHPPKKPEPTDAMPGGQPETAFTLDFPGYFHITAKTFNKLDFFGMQPKMLH